VEAEASRLALGCIAFSRSRLELMMKAVNPENDRKIRIFEIEVVKSLSQPVRYNIILKLADAPDREAWFDMDLTTEEEALTLAKLMAERAQQRQGAGQWQRWLGLFEQFPGLSKWSLCRGLGRRE
jgi:hypothetical protein